MVWLGWTCGNRPECGTVEVFMALENRVEIVLSVVLQRLPWLCKIMGGWEWVYGASARLVGLVLKWTIQKFRWKRLNVDHCRNRQSSWRCDVGGEIILWSWATLSVAWLSHEVELENVPGSKIGVQRWFLNGFQGENTTCDISIAIYQDEDFSLPFSPGDILRERDLQRLALLSKIEESIFHKICILIWQCRG